MLRKVRMMSKKWPEQNGFSLVQTMKQHESSQMTKALAH